VTSCGMAGGPDEATHPARCVLGAVLTWRSLGLAGKAQSE